MIAEFKEYQDFSFAGRQKNLVYNSDFRYFSNRTGNVSSQDYGHPDGWVFAAAQGGTIGYDAVEEACIVTTGSSTARFSLKQELHEFPRWRQCLPGEIVTAKVEMEISANAAVRLFFSDGVVSEARDFQNTGAESLAIAAEMRLTVDPKAAGLSLSIESASPSASFRIHRVYANKGRVALSDLPCIIQGVIGECKRYIATETPPVEELSLCEESVEVAGDYTRLDSVLNGRFGTGENNRSLLPDLRGYFGRNWNNGAKRDPDAGQRTNAGKGTIVGDHVGTAQEDAFASHKHGFTTFSQSSAQSGGPPAAGSAAKDDTNEAGGSETRPRNFSELYTIKWA